MRGAFFDAVVKLAEEDDRIFLVVGDLGFAVTDEFRSRFPERFLNAGVAEQNMTGVAAGLALSGFTVFTYSIANFPILRCLEQIRNDVCYHRANVKIVSVGGGFAYGSLGASHHATEDLGILRVLPEIILVAPGDPQEAGAATEAVAQYKGPCYLRLGRAGEVNVHTSRLDFKLGKAIELRAGGDATLISTGGMLVSAMEVADYLAKRGIDAGVMSMHTLKPLDVDAVLSAARKTTAIFTLEEHSIIGGLGTAVAETLSESGVQDVIFRRFALPSEFCCKPGSQEYLRAEYGLSPNAMGDAIYLAMTKHRMSTATAQF